MNVTLPIHTIDDFDYSGKTVLLRVDINSPIDPKTKRIVNTNRIDKSIPTIRDLLDRGAKVAILAHQGDTLDYHNLMPMAEHALLLSERLRRPVKYIDDVAGPAAQQAVKDLQPGEAILLGNVRYLCEEISTFEDAVTLKPEEMLNTYLVRNLAPLADYYVNDAFAAAHRNAPSMVAFPELLPTAGGRQLIAEFGALSRVAESPERPAVFVLGGLKVSDAYGMLRQVLENGTADRILTGGVTGILFQMARGVKFGQAQEKFLANRGLLKYVDESRMYLERFGEKFINPVDFAYEDNGVRKECSLADLPNDAALFMDIGTESIALFEKEIAQAGTIFVNGPVGAYENALFEKGTKSLWNAIADAPGFSVVGGGDSVTAASRFVENPAERFGYICTAGGAMVRFLSGVELPLITALRKAYGRKY
ncbi:MAG: phosphoglycerate kinase [Limnochordia bacterium]|jgi:phosphoglycerate kinase|nr:MAG: phosphoglycerate kinase [Peptococcaceae bacterium 1109]